MSIGTVEDGGQGSQDAKSLEPDLTRKTFTFSSVCVYAGPVRDCVYTHGVQYLCVHTLCGLSGCYGPWKATDIVYLFVAWDSVFDSVLNLLSGNSFLSQTLKHLYLGQVGLWLCLMPNRKTSAGTYLLERLILLMVWGETLNLKRKLENFLPSFKKDLKNLSLRVESQNGYMFNVETTIKMLHFLEASNN